MITAALLERASATLPDNPVNDTTEQADLRALLKFTAEVAILSKANRPGIADLFDPAMMTFELP